MAYRYANTPSNRREGKVGMTQVEWASHQETRRYKNTYENRYMGRVGMTRGEHNEHTRLFHRSETKHASVGDDRYTGTVRSVENSSGDGTLTLPNGYGIKCYLNGERYHGEWKTGQRCGIGKFYYEDGSKYEGNWLNDKKLPEQYFLSLGTNEPRKNLPNLIKAFRKFKQNPNNAKIGLVLVGGKGWLSDDLKLNELQEEQIYPLGFLPDEDLPLVYSGALAFIFPSFYEGFGLPLVEAMSCGTPVITSDNSSLREVAGNCGIYLQPEKIDSIKEAMEIFIEELPNRKTLEEQSLIRAKEFSWAKTAEKTLDVYNYLLS